VINLGKFSKVPFEISLCTAIHDVVKAFGDEKSQVLQLFHAFTGCKQTSAFSGRGKSSAWATLMSYGEVTAVFTSLSKKPTIQDVLDVMPVLERLIVLMYDWTSHCQRVNAARNFLFAQKGGTLK